MEELRRVGWGLYTKHRGIIFSMSRNVVVSFADVVATIWNIVYDLKTRRDLQNYTNKTVFEL